MPRCRDYGELGKKHKRKLRSRAAMEKLRAAAAQPSECLVQYTVLLYTFDPSLLFCSLNCHCGSIRRSPRCFHRPDHSCVDFCQCCTFVSVASVFVNSWLFVWSIGAKRRMSKSAETHICMSYRVYLVKLPHKLSIRLHQYLQSVLDILTQEPTKPISQGFFHDFLGFSKS